MSDFLDILLNAKENGITLDSCGSDERQYSWGLYTDLCGMSVEDARKAASACCGGGGDEPETGKTANKVIFSLEPTLTGGYALTLKFSAAPTAPVIASYRLNGIDKTISIPAGIIEYQTGDAVDDKYATLDNISFTSIDEKYEYSAVNNVKTGIFKIKFILDGKTYLEDNVKYNSKITIPDTPTGYTTGYDFNWKDSGTGEIVTGEYTMPEKDVIINGVHVIHSWMILYSYDGIELPGGTVKVDFGTTLNTLPIIKETGKTGYDFIQWKTSDGAILPSKMPDNDITIIGEYKIRKHSLILKVDEAIIFTEEYNYGAEISQSAWPTPEKEGYTFLNWGTIPSTMPDNDVTLDAKFEINTYTLIYKLDKEGEIKTTTESYRFNEKISWKEISEEGFTFSGWDIKSEYTNMPAENIEANATLERNSYTYRFFANGEIISSGETPYQGIIVKPADPEKEGHEFIGWDKEIPAAMPAENLTFDAIFNILSYDIIYKVDGIEWAKESHKYGSPITIHNEPTKEGYEFSGWDAVLPATMPAENLTINGTFTVMKFNLSYWVDSKLEHQEEVEYGSEIISRESPTKEGHTFSGWVNEPETMPSHDVIVNGYFAVNQYSLKYIVDGEDYTSKVYNFDEAIVPIANPEKDGYTFNGWTESIPSTMPSHDVEIHGSFSINSYTITYLIDDETARTDTYEYNANVTPYEPSERTGYNFSGWSGVKPMPSKMGAENLVFNGSYIPIPYELSFAIEGQPTTASTKYYGDTIVAPVPEKREGYKFAWDKPVPATMPPNNLSFVGTYTEMTDSTMIYYGILPQSKAGSLTSEEITSLNSFDSALSATTLYEVPIPFDSYLKELYDEEDEMEEEEAEEFEENVVQPYIRTHMHGFYIASPTSIEISLVDRFNTEFEISAVQENITIDDTEYIVYMYGDDKQIKPQTSTKNTFAGKIITK